jgi:hypothetical protein
MGGKNGIASIVYEIADIVGFLYCSDRLAA